jgi:hypothetical protein
MLAALVQPEEGIARLGEFEGTYVAGGTLGAGDSTLIG